MNLITKLQSFSWSVALLLIKSKKSQVSVRKNANRCLDSFPRADLGHKQQKNYKQTGTITQILKEQHSVN